MERGVFDQLLLVFQWLCVMTVDSVDQTLTFTASPKGSVTLRPKVAEENKSPQDCCWYVTMVNILIRLTLMQRLYYTGSTGRFPESVAFGNPQLHRMRRPMRRLKRPLNPRAKQKPRLRDGLVGRSQG